MVGLGYYKIYHGRILQQVEVTLLKLSEINVATLNYAGITYSPFEFYSGDDEDEKELKNLSEIFREIASQRGKLPG